MPTTSETLRQYAFFTEASAALKSEISAAATAVRIPQGTYFFQKGEAVQNVCLVGVGSVRVYMIGASGRELTLYHVGPGETCPINLLCALLDRHAPADAYVEAALDGVMIAAKTFRTWAAEEPIICRFVFEALAVRQIDVLERVEEIAFQRIDRRLADCLLQHLNRASGGEPTVRVTHEQIANEIGSAREVVTRVLKTFERCGAIELGRGYLVVRNTALLQSFVGSIPDS